MIEVDLAEPALQARTSSGRRPRTTILCVDDEPMVLAALRVNLQRQYDVLCASSGAEGLEILRTAPRVAVIVSDMRMPQMTGAVFLNRARDVAPDAVRILLTGEADLQSAMSAINDGQIFRFLSKPCPRAQLLAEIRAAVAQHRTLCLGRRAMESALASGAANGEARSALHDLLEHARRIFDVPWAALGLHDGGSATTEVIACGLDERIFLEPGPGDDGDLLRRLDAGVLRHSSGIVSGLPPRHPRVTHLLGAPIATATQVHGWYYLAGDAGEAAFGPDDERTAAMLGSSFASICERASLHRRVELTTAALVEQRDQVERLSLQDSVTRLPNRRVFTQRLREMPRPARGRRVLVAIDVERLKSRCDRLEAARGDEQLRTFAGRVLGVAGDGGLAARIGDDRFAILMREPEGGWVMAQDGILAALDAPTSPAGGEPHVELRAGVALEADGDDDADPEDLLRQAELALTAAKSGAVPWVRYTGELGAAIAQRSSLESRLRTALVRGEFRLHYQPKVDVGSGRIRGAEALLRWDSPEMGMVPPSQFVGLLEQTGLILPVGEWALAQAMRDHAAWQAQGLAPPPVAVNVSPLQLQQPRFIDTVQAALRGNPLTPPALVIEITESMLMADLDGSIAKLAALRGMGIPVAIDDFGTGYSSLSYLARLPISALKIDRSFVVRMGDSTEDMAIISMILSLARALNLRVVAEGVETVEQLKFLKLMRCDEYQGFLFSRPVSAEHFANLLRSDLDPNRP